MKEKTDLGGRLRSVDIKKKIKEINDNIGELTTIKNSLEKGLVAIETDKILNKFPSVEVYSLLKMNLTKRYNLTKTEIETLKNSLKMIGNDLQWFEWIDRFGKHIQEKRNLSDIKKRELLNTILDKILVDYNPIEKVHILILNFKIPVMFRDVDEGRETTRVIVTPPKSGRKPKNQNEPFRNYSTVTDLARFLG